MRSSSTRSSPEIPPSLLIGVPSIDQEHCDLISHLDSLMANPDYHPRSEAFSEILNRLGRQITTHFENEENIFTAFDMPVDEVLSHVQAHNVILEQYTGLCLDLMRGKALDHSEVLAMIKHWIIDHVENHDLKIRDYLPSETSSVPITRNPVLLGTGG